jgi:hypothetical protein
MSPLILSRHNGRRKQIKRQADQFDEALMKALERTLKKECRK